MKKIIPFFLLLSVLIGCSDEATKQESEQVDLADTTARLHIISDSKVKVDTVALKKMPDSAKKHYLKQKRIERNDARMKAMQEKQ